MNLNQALEEQLAWHELFRRLGFTPEEIHLGLNSVQVWTEVRSQGKVFVATPVMLLCNEGILRVAWQERIDWWNSNETPEAERDRVWRRSRARSDAVEAVGSLCMKGFKLPKPVQEARA